MKHQLVRLLVWTLHAVIAFIVLSFVRVQSGFEDMVVLGFAYVIADIYALGYLLLSRK